MSVKTIKGDEDNIKLHNLDAHLHVKIDKDETDVNKILKCHSNISRKQTTKQKDILNEDEGMWDGKTKIMIQLET